MKSFALAAGLVTCLSPMLLGCATSREDQREALTHQQKSDEAAKRGAYGVAAQEQLNAEDKHHDAVVKALKEGEPIPQQTQPGDKPSQQP